MLLYITCQFWFKFKSQISFIAAIYFQSPFSQGGVSECFALRFGPVDSCREALVLWGTGLVGFSWVIKWRKGKAWLEYTPYCFGHLWSVSPFAVRCTKKFVKAVIKIFLPPNIFKWIYHIYIIIWKHVCSKLFNSSLPQIGRWKASHNQTTKRTCVILHVFCVFQKLWLKDIQPPGG